ncbi:Endo-1,4-beta-xylanase, GH35 family [Chitinophaga jiangningensis]|uniref:Beta-xylanase n=1 Tax=Chitinophaga jiangningensis TaxID=1419482 RepID=A0A1M7ITQ2_9BACT|nr:endo-1,4-beta-xylanase [Chitinophaga jiangningensis]SHM43993.1 Endo-1,4-beta-xylanase, GH35 family [Chitinophaga jiangningensis]
MKRIFTTCLILAAMASYGQQGNPVIYADVPDISIIRNGDTYYMSSTTMHLFPGVPVMKSNDLINWKTISYAASVPEESDALNLANGQNAYGKGTWASSLRYHKGTWYLSTFSGTTGKTYIYQTKNIEKGPWKGTSFKPALHDHSLFFDDNGNAYMLYGAGEISLVELNKDLSGIRPGTSPKVIIHDASSPAGPNIGLRAEGSQLFKHEGKYYLFNICWPKGGMRTVVIHRADKLEGPWEGRVGLQDRGVAQGGLINTPKGEWYAYLFRDNGAVGRVPYLVPVTWKDGWPVIGTDGKIPDTLNLPRSKGYNPGIVCSDEFTRKPGEPALPLAWQWNHQPDNQHWSLSQRPGYLRITTGRIDQEVTQARNTLTQRTFGPISSGTTAIDVSGMKDGDYTGLMLLQKNYGWVGVKDSAGAKWVVMINTRGGKQVEEGSIPLQQKVVYLKALANFRNGADKGYFYYSLDGADWKPIGGVLQMSYTIPHFMGYRFGLFNFATRETGGQVDVDFFHIEDKVSFDSSKVVADKGLKDYYQSYFPIGAAVTPWSLKGPEAALITQQFNSVTPENAMKMAVIHPREDVYNFTGADSIVAFAVRNGIKVRGHALCWHNQAPGWMFKDEKGDTVSKEILLQRLKAHIHTVVTRYKGKVYAWDVVNEVISDQRDEYYRNSAWLRICGPEFIEKAFRWAHEADPDAILFYNDYNEISPVKRAKIIRMINELKQQGVPVQAVGLQAHWAVNEPTEAQLESTLKDFSTLHLPLQITELDISVYPKEHESRAAKPADSMMAFTPAREQAQMEQYKRCFDLFRKYKHQITGVTFWNVSDKASWLDNFPVRGRKDYPLLFNQQLQPKKAFWQVALF